MGVHGNTGYAWVRWARAGMMIVGVAGLWTAGCDRADPNAPSDMFKNRKPPKPIVYDVDWKTIQFKDEAQTNAQVAAEGFSKLNFTDISGKVLPFSTLLGKKYIVLVMTRGFSGEVCPFCSTQTARLISNYEQIKKLGAEVVLVYPVATNTPSDSHLEEFMKVTNAKLEKQVAQAPFPILLDLELKSVSALGIKADLSKPATYILDLKGQVQFAYVGSTIADRPSVAALVKHLERLPRLPEDPPAPGESKPDAKVDDKPEAKSDAGEPGKPTAIGRVAGAVATTLLMLLSSPK